SAVFRGSRVRFCRAVVRASDFTGNPRALAAVEPRGGCVVGPCRRVRRGMCAWPPIGTTRAALPEILPRRRHSRLRRGRTRLISSHAIGGLHVIRRSCLAVLHLLGDPTHVATAHAGSNACAEAWAARKRAKVEGDPARAPAGNHAASRLSGGSLHRYQ